ncbi:MAG: tRNA (N6-threonylcarbamoyladenosine(37)-N6)-methyltransferase TrmO [Candidatus Eremiobacteraeota bacterium]|nr:tRNA (N6-threonylcarbamoyladenosine(37)-N6)-methyltransferase TrmO [Candidatus Eremiobacteraeota bacterium]MCW5869301.1 tRNA (N6-threonylcarbamoyladenosine(37)-N6)-methyltransferase TrmO [Candidatus Eremiobacteraeota bacterium]
MNLEPIGVLRSSAVFLGALPRQPQAGEGVVELVPGRHLDHAVHDLPGFSRIWLIWWFHRSKGEWRPKVLPPRSRCGRKGVLATRSPHRPNPLGISAVPLLRVEGLRLWIGAHDLVDGTPILDIKPYLPRYDSFPNEREGWLAQVEAGSWQVELGPVVQGLELAERVRAILAEDPLPHRARRIHAMPDGRLRLGIGFWRFFYRIEGARVLVESALFKGLKVD